MLADSLVLDSLVVAESLVFLGVCVHCDECRCRAAIKWDEFLK